MSKKIIPITYYGGKQNLVDDILPMIPEHRYYVEPFCGGATLFWRKRRSIKETLNDYNLSVYNFWEVCRTDFKKLQSMIQKTMHHEHDHRKAKEILLAPMKDRVLYAWAFWVRTTMSFSSVLFGGFAFGNSDKANNAKTTRAKREGFTEPIYNRLKDIEIFNRDAIELILMKDNEDTFMYFDPPYAESDCGHYEKEKDVYYRLLEILPTLKCQWLMSSYPSEQLTQLREAENWYSRDVEQNLSVSGKHNGGKVKTECLTWNYKYSGQTMELFK